MILYFHANPQRIGTAVSSLTINNTYIYKWIYINIFCTWFRLFSAMRTTKKFSKVKSIGLQNVFISTMVQSHLCCVKYNRQQTQSQTHVHNHTLQWINVCIYMSCLVWALLTGNKVFSNCKFELYHVHAILHKIYLWLQHFDYDLVYLITLTC